MSSPADAPQIDPEDFTRELEQLTQLVRLREKERDEATQLLYQDRKRFDAERQQLRGEITDLKKLGGDSDRTAADEVRRRLEQQEADLKREREGLSEELTDLRRQALELEECRLEVQQLTESLRQAAAELELLRGKSVTKEPASETEPEIEMAAPPERQAAPPAVQEAPPVPVAPSPPERKAAVPVAEAPAPEKPVPQAPLPETPAPAPKLAEARVERGPSALTESAKRPNLPIKPLAKSWQERRRFPRRRGNPIPVILTDSETGDDGLGGWITDRSAGGLRLLVDQEFAVGQRMNVRSARAPDAPWIEIEVKHCNKDSGGWSIGCQFLNEKLLSWGERQQFG